MNCPSCGGFMSRVRDPTLLYLMALRDDEVAWVCGHQGFHRRNPQIHRPVPEGGVIPACQMDWPTYRVEVVP